MKTKQFLVVFGIIALVAIVITLIRQNQKVCTECTYPDGTKGDFCGKRKYVSAYKIYRESPLIEGINQTNSVGGTCSPLKWNDSWSTDPDS
jgi:hypothetical protein